MNSENFAVAFIDDFEARLESERVVGRVAAVCVRAIPAGRNGEIIEVLVVDGCYPSTSMCWDYLESPPAYVLAKNRG